MSVDIQREANWILQPISTIVRRPGSWHNGKALADGSASKMGVGLVCESGPHGVSG